MTVAAACIPCRSRTIQTRLAQSDQNLADIEVDFDLKPSFQRISVPAIRPSRVLFPPRCCSAVSPMPLSRVTLPTAAWSMVTVISPMPMSTVTSLPRFASSTSPTPISSSKGMSVGTVSSTTTCIPRDRHIPIPSSLRISLPRRSRESSAMSSARSAQRSRFVWRSHRTRTSAVIVSTSAPSTRTSPTGTSRTMASWPEGSKSSLIVRTVRLWACAATGQAATASSTVLRTRRRMGSPREGLETGVRIRPCWLMYGLSSVPVSAVAASHPSVRLPHLRWMSSMLFEVQTSDPWVIGAVAAGLGLVAILSGYLPARRATSVDPLTALAGNRETS